MLHIVTSRMGADASVLSSEYPIITTEPSKAHHVHLEKSIEDKKDDESSRIHGRLLRDNSEAAKRSVRLERTKGCKISGGSYGIVIAVNSDSEPEDDKTDEDITKDTVTPEHVSIDVGEPGSEEHSLETNGAAIKIMKPTEWHGVAPDIIREIEAAVMLRGAKAPCVAVPTHVDLKTGALLMPRYACTLSDMGKDTACRRALRNEALAAGVIRDVLRALKAAHEECDLANRDIKPPNVLMDLAAGVARLGDWGMAARSAPLDIGAPCTRGGTDVVTTLWYRSPEVVVSGGRRSLSRVGPSEELSMDVWAVGMVAAHLLRGGPPFAGNRTAEYRKFLDAMVDGGVHELERHSRLGTMAEYRGLCMDVLRADLESKGVRDATPGLHPAVTAADTPHNRHAYFEIAKRLSAEAHDFLWRALEVAPSRRNTAAQLLEHPWIMKAVPWTSSDILVNFASQRALRVERSANRDRTAFPDFVRSVFDEALGAGHGRPVDRYRVESNTSIRADPIPWGPEALYERRAGNAWLVPPDARYEGRKSVRRLLGRVVKLIVRHVSRCATAARIAPISIARFILSVTHVAWMIPDDFFAKDSERAIALLHLMCKTVTSSNHRDFMLSVLRKTSGLEDRAYRDVFFQGRVHNIEHDIVAQCGGIIPMLSEFDRNDIVGFLDDTYRERVRTMFSVDHKVSKPFEEVANDMRRLICEVGAIMLLAEPEWIADAIDRTKESIRRRIAFQTTKEGVVWRMSCREVVGPALLARGSSGIVEALRRRIESAFGIQVPGGGPRLGPGAVDTVLG